MSARSVWKFRMDGPEMTITVPDGARLVHAAAQFDADKWPTLWFEVDPSTERVSRNFSIYGTGFPIPPNVEYRASVLVYGGTLVWHIYEWEGVGDEL